MWVSVVKEIVKLRLRYSHQQSGRKVHGSFLLLTLLDHWLVSGCIASWESGDFIATAQLDTATAMQRCKSEMDVGLSQAQQRIKQLQASHSRKDDLVDSLRKQLETASKAARPLKHWIQDWWANTIMAVQWMFGNVWVDIRSLCIDDGVLCWCGDWSFIPSLIVWGLLLVQGSFMFQHKPLWADTHGRYTCMWILKHIAHLLCLNYRQQTLRCCRRKTVHMRWLGNWRKRSKEKVRQ